jgi:hypothetical protein
LGVLFSDPAVVDLLHAHQHELRTNPSPDLDVAQRRQQVGVAAIERAQSRDRKAPFAPVIGLQAHGQVALFGCHGANALTLDALASNAKRADRSEHSNWTNIQYIEGEIQPAPEALRAQVVADAAM